MVLARASEPRPCLIPPDQRPEHEGKPTLVLDMNHTLVSSVTSPDQRYDFVSKVRGSDGTLLTLKRPFVDDFLRQVARVYEIVVFTSCDRRIADPILDELDPEGRLFAHRLYTEHCSWSSEVGHVKDLSMLGRGMERVVIVDDSESKCVWNLDNWVRVSSFWDNPDDRELLDLVPFLLGLAKVEDVRPVVRKWRLQNFRK
ncbi:hypothetical protein SELMODRAFT_103542 [Selaginella moellendorffii]|uniref:FCP1 homology domain-containing protein n=1 Tax=Selaginella moellendorffii TaxID=88036 RepID=D8RWT2_SELML|nr:probable C-terminal domain small phosphatase [Selaginella moellendorffii]EFJ23145.1 hypothetical protein SELMODRAFT_103542 [Selaginella moellendorffii]|eukprot:XP_002975516.1 probable C-terminal domain small phosphatase [Selaginella moellendorffii]